MKEAIRGRFEGNLARVTSLVDLYEAQLPGQGRASVKTTDLLRAAVVFLHATLEDLLRTALAWKLPVALAEHLRDVPLIGCGRGGREPRFSLVDLARHRGRSVDAVLAESVAAHLGDSNFNDPGQVEGVLAKLGLRIEIVAPHKNTLGPMMSRRHWIVHRADRNDMPGSGQYAARSISAGTVRRWLEAVRNFGGGLLDAL